MKWYNKLQFITMILAVAGVAIDWRFGLWMSVLFSWASLIALVAQIVVERRAYNIALRAPLRWGLFAMIAYWLMLLASVLYSADLSAATKVLNLKCTLLFFPLAALLTNTSWLTTKHLRALGYAMVLGLLGLFLYDCGIAVGKMANGATLASVTRIEFDARHHTYTAAYLAIALLFIYHELYTRWKELPRWWRTLLLVTSALFILFTIIVNSRAGMLVLYAIEAFCILHFAVTRRRWGWAALLAVLLAGYTLGMEKALPGHQERVAQTVSDVTSDVRLKIYKNDLDVSMGSPVVGYGAGDYIQHLDDNYASKGMNYHYNAHNQYLETMLSIGVIGLALFLVWLLWPLLIAWLGLRRGNVSAPVFWFVFMATFCVAFNFLFESMLERQMGLLFVGPLMSIITLIISNEQNKFGQLPKK